MSGKIVFKEWITRDFVRANPEARFVFGDNVARRGMGGQAAAMRGEPNAIGVATKWKPDMEEGSFFDDELPSISAMCGDLLNVIAAWKEGRTIYVPADGLGTGLSKLPTKAPRTYKMLYLWFEALAGGQCPWEAPR